VTTFEAPAAPSAGLNYTELNGSLLLITVNSVEENFSTQFGIKPAVRADVVVLDGKEAGTEEPDTMILPKVLVNQLRPKIGSTVLGRLSQGKAKSGQKAPWLLDPPTADDMKIAELWSGDGGSDQAEAEKPPF
jgi:hypothetical protein